MEILALLLRKNKSIKPYRTKFGHEHFIDMYADDLSVYLEFKKKANLKINKMSEMLSKPWIGSRSGLG